MPVLPFIQHSKFNIQHCLTKYFEIILYLVVLAVPLVFIQKCEDAYYLPKLAVLSLGFQFFVLFLVNARSLNVDIADKILITFLIIYLLGTIPAPAKEDAFIRYFEWLCAAGVYFYIKYYFSAEKIKRLFILMLSSGSIAVLYALLQSFNIDFAGWITDFSGRAFSTFGNPDFFGGFLVVLMPACFVLNKKIAGNVFVILAYALLISQTRSSLIAFIVSMCVAAYLFRDRLKKDIIIIAVVITAVVIVILASGRAGDALQRFKNSLVDSGISGRTAMWKTGIRMSVSNPVLGAGIHSVEPHYHEYKSGSRYLETDRLHNDFIEVFAESGYAAGILFLAFIFLLGRALYRKKTVAAYAGLTAMTAICVHAFFNFPFYILGSKLYFFTFAGAALNREQGAHKGVSWVPLSSFIIIPVLMFVAGSMYLNKGINELNAKSMDKARLNFAKAERLYPFAKKYYYLSAVNYAGGGRDTAEEYIKKYLEIYPASKSGIIRAGIIAAEKKNYDSALQIFDKFLKYYPEDTEMLNNKGKALFLKGDIKGAADTFSRAFKADPASEITRKNLKAVEKILAQ